MTNDEIEIAFVREFQVLGNDLSGNVSREARMERIRLEIFKNARDKLRFFDTDMNYVEAFQRCFGRAAERRKVERKTHTKPDEVITKLFTED